MNLLELESFISVGKTNNEAKHFIENELYVTIDSSKRQQTASQILEPVFITCPPNPISVLSKTNVIRLKIPTNSNLALYDQIIIDNIELPYIFFSGAVFVGRSSILWEGNTNGFSQILQNIPSKESISLPFVVSFFTVNSASSTLPNDAINGITTVIIYIDNNRVYFTIESRNRSWPSSETPIQVSFKLMAAHIGGIPIDEIQANLPIDELHGRGSRTILSMNSDYIEFNTPTSFSKFSVPATGGSSIFINKVLSESNGYVSPSSYFSRLDRTYSNVFKIRVLNSEFPCTIINVDGSTSLSYEGDSFPFLGKKQVTPKRGCYSPRRLLQTLIDLMNAQESVFFSEESSRRRIFKYQFNDISEISCKVYVSVNVKKSIAITSGINKLQVTVKSHGLVNGDKVRIICDSSREKIEDYPFDIKITKIGTNNFNPDVFIVQVTPKIIEYVSKQEFVDFEIVSRFRLFTSSLLPIIGFPNEITSYTHTHSSSKPYRIWPFTYIELRIRPDQPVDGVTPVLLISDYTISRIRLNEEYINKYVIEDVSYNWVVRFNPSLSTLSGLNIFLVWPDGSIPDFDGANHSFTLGITENNTKVLQESEPRG